MSHQQHRSLKHEYELYVEREIEDYKDSIPRSAILSIGDEAVAKLRAQEQVAFDELVLWDGGRPHNHEPAAYSELRGMEAPSTEASRGVPPAGTLGHAA